MKFNWIECDHFSLMPDNSESEKSVDYYCIYLLDLLSVVC